MSAVVFDHHTPFPGPWALVPTLGAALFIWANTNQAPGPAGRSILARPLPVGLGKISYSLYLWHWPLLVLPRYVNDGPLSKSAVGLALAATLISAYLSWRLVENPIRFRKVLGTRRAIFTASALSLIGLVLAGHAIRQSEGFIDRLPLPARLYASGVNDRYSSPPWTVYPVQARLNGVDYEFTAWDVRPDRPQEFMVIGNSHARMWLAAVDLLADKYSIGGVVVNPTDYKGCDYIRDGGSTPGRWNCNDLLTAFLDLAQERGLKQVLLAIRYAPMLDLTVKPESPGPVGRGAEELAEGLGRLLEAAQARGLELWLVENVPEYEESLPHTLAWNALKHRDPGETGYSRKYFENRNNGLDRLRPGLEARGLRFLPVGGIICPQERCLTGDDRGGSYYMDDNHLTRYGAVRFRSALVPFFESLRPAEPGSAEAPVEGRAARPLRP